MAAPNLIDFDNVDLSTVQADREELERYLKQRGDFSMIDAVLREGTEDGLVIGYKEIREDDWWAPIHIPGRPLFPGALMVESAAQLASYDYLKYQGKITEGKFVGFGGLEKTRFRSSVTPNCRMYFAVKLLRARSKMFVYETQGFVDQKRVFEAEVMGVVV